MLIKIVGSVMCRLIAHMLEKYFEQAKNVSGNSLMEDKQAGILWQFCLSMAVINHS